MKAKVLTKFKDKHNGKVYQVGEVITISKERYEEILTVAPLVEEVKAKAKKAAKSDPAAIE